MRSVPRPEGEAHANITRAMLKEHQPEDGQWGSDCQGEHDPRTAWPCPTVKSFNDPAAWIE